MYCIECDKLSTFVTTCTCITITGLKVENLQNW